MTFKWITLLTASLPVFATPVLACHGKTVQFEDDFQVADPAWGSPSENYAIGGGQLKISPRMGRSYVAWYEGALFQDADICVTVTVPSAEKPAEASAGLMFWAVDNDNYYYFGISPTGMAAVLRYQSGNRLTPVSWRKADGLKTGAGDVNVLRITLKGNAATTYLNDLPFAAFRGFPPTEGSYLAFQAASEKNAQNTWVFTNLKITATP